MNRLIGGFQCRKKQGMVTITNYSPFNREMANGVSTNTKQLKL